MIERSDERVPRRRCPTCGHFFDPVVPDTHRHRPFCSKRCQLIDLGKWFNGEYVISVPLNESAEGSGPPLLNAD